MSKTRQVVEDPVAEFGRVLAECGTNRPCMVRGVGVIIATLGRHMAENADTIGTEAAAEVLRLVESLARFVSEVILGA